MITRVANDKDRLVGDVLVQRLSPTVLGIGLAALSLTLTLYFFLRSHQLAPTSEFGGVFEAGVAGLFGFFTAAALISLGLAHMIRRKSPGASFAAAIAGIVFGSVPATLVLAFMILQQLG